MMSSSTLAAISRPAMLAAMLLAAGQPAFAAENETMKIVNNTAYDMAFQGVQRRQAIKIVTSPPDTVQAGQTGSFEFTAGSSLKNQRLRLQYNLTAPATGQLIGTVEFGIKPSSCFADSNTPEATGSINGCHKVTSTYTYQ